MTLKSFSRLLFSHIFHIFIYFKTPIYASTVSPCLLISASFPKNSAAEPSASRIINFIHSILLLVSPLKSVYGKKVSKISHSQDKLHVCACIGACVRKISLQVFFVLLSKFLSKPNRTISNISELI